MLRMIHWLVHHGTTVGLAAVAVFLFGTLSYVTLPRESSPDITIPVVIISTPYVGVSPEDIESLLTIPLENELASLKNVKEMRSTSAEGVSIVVIEFEPDVVIEDALQRVRDRVGRVRPTLPDDVEESSIREISFSDVPVVLVNLAGGNEAQLKALAEKLQEDITRIQGVLDAKISGGTEREIRVQVIPERLAHYGLSLNDVRTAIADENVNIPGGNVQIGRGNFLLRVPGEFSDPSELEGVAIKRVGDRPVFVRDLARVVDGVKERETYSRMAGQPSVTVSVTKRAGANILEVAEGVKEVAAEHAERWPEGVEWRALGDQSEYIAQSVDDLQNNIITALILVVAVIVLFMGWRSSLFVALSIPLSMLGSMIVIDALGFTLNMVVLFSLILALGMLVDNAIVVVENVYRHSEMGKDPRTAAIEGTGEVAVPVAASTATTVAAFLPLVFWTGIMGEFMGFLPKTVIIVLTASLVVAVCILPVLMSRTLSARAQDERTPEHMRDRELGGPMRLYQRMLELSIRFRYLAVAGMVGLLFFTFAVFAVFNHGSEFFPVTQPDRARVGVRLPQGTDVETTDKVVRHIESVLAAEPNVDIWVAESGVSADGDALGGSSALPNEARITVDFLPDRNAALPGERIRSESTLVTAERLRAAAALLPGANITMEAEEMGPPVGPEIQVEVSGEDFDEVGELATKLRRALAGIDGITDLEDDYRIGRPELRLRIDRGAAKGVGVSTAAIGDAVRTAVAGAKATTLRDGEDEYDIMVQLGPQYRDDLQAILALRLPGREDTSPSTFPVPISAVASYELVGGSGSIRHIDQDLVVTIGGDVLFGYNANDVRADVQELLDGWPDLPEGAHFELTGADEEQEESAAFLGRAFLIACVLILLVLVTQFDSLAMPAIIIATVVLSLIGVLWGLLVTGTPFGIIMTGIGVISLAGVVVNNAIVLLDYVQQLERRGLGVHEALVEAGLTRFRPVMLTAITTTLGLIPMALGVAIDFTGFKLILGSTSAQWWGPMAVAVIFGLTFATVLTLVMVPTLYGIYDDLRRLPARFRRAPAAAATTAALLLALPTPAPAVTLEEAYAAADTHNVDLAVAREQTIQQGTLRGKAWSALSPRLEAKASYIVNEKEIPFDSSDAFTPLMDALGPLIPPGTDLDFGEPTIIQQKEFWQADVTVSQRLFNGSAIPGLHAAYRLTRAARLQEDHQRQQIRLGVASAYYQLLAATEQVGVAEASLRTAEGQLDLAQRQVQAGLAASRAELQARLSVNQATRDSAAAREGQVTAEEQFATQTGLRDVELQWPGEVAVPPSLDEALRRAPTQRADIEAAELRTEAVLHQRIAQDLRWLPVVDGAFSYLYDENTGFSDDPTFWRASLTASWTLWDGGLRSAERRETASQYRVTQLEKTRVERGAEEEIRVAWEAYHRADAALASVESELLLAEENRRLAEATFQAGSGTWLEVEQAELTLLSTQYARLAERTRRDLAALQLNAATGRL